MDIATINYEKGACSHNDLYGIRNLCNGRTECTFKVTNSNVGSSCGANGTASLEVTYNCIRELYSLTCFINDTLMAIHSTIHQLIQINQCLILMTTNTYQLWI